MASERRRRVRRAGVPWAAALAAAGLALVPPAVAEELEKGEWSGRIKSKGRAEKVTYEVDFPSITMTWGVKEYPFRDVRLAAGRLEFYLDFNRTDRNRCVLVKEESGRYEGRCGEEEPKVFILLMIPPRPSGSGGDEDG